MSGSESDETLGLDGLIIVSIAIVVIVVSASSGLSTFTVAGIGIEYWIQYTTISLATLLLIAETGHAHGYSESPIYDQIENRHPYAIVSILVLAGSYLLVGIDFLTSTFVNEGGLPFAPGDYTTGFVVSLIIIVVHIAISKTRFTNQSLWDSDESGDTDSDKTEE